MNSLQLSPGKINADRQQATKRLEEKMDKHQQ
jgi:hypothetical protein